MDKNPDSNEIKILLVEDNPGDARLVEMMLSQSDSSYYCLMVADSLQAASELIDENEFQAALLDMSLPDGDGIDNITRLKSCKSNLPIVVLSGRFDESFALDTVKVGAQDYLVKGEIDHWKLVRALNYSIERKHLQDNIDFMAHHDQLTGLANRVLFRSRLSHAIQSAERRKELVAVLYLDLDHFKAINDGLGHEMGDKLLCEVANRLKKSVREVDTVARLGGDEFAIVLEGVTETNSAVTIAEKIIDVLSKSIAIEENTLYVGTSIGIAFYPHCGLDVDSITKNADSAMYKAKRNGRNQYQFYTSKMNHHALDELNMEMQLREALENDEFVLHYQPKMNLKNGKLTGNEALLRWNHREQGMLYPTKFIPVLEQNGMITEVGQWMIETACVQHEDWVKQGLSVGKIAINLSGRQLTQYNFSNIISNILNRTGLDPASFEVELTESLLIQNTELTMRFLDSLKSMGISIAIDDFGTGYSSFSYLKRFLVDTIKIDRSFIKNITQEGPDAAISSAIIQLAKDLEIHVVAEGVETQEQVDYLKERQVDEIQGFFVSPPLSSEAFCHLVNSSNAKVA